MAKTDKVWIELTRTEANALMDSEIETIHVHGGIDLKNWETLDLEAYKLLAFHKYKTWYWENCGD